MKKRTIAFILIFTLGPIFALFLFIGIYSPRQDKEYPGKYGDHFHGDKITEDAVLPAEYISVEQDIHSIFVSKRHFSYGGEEYYIYFSYGNEYIDTIYPGLYNEKTNEKIAVLWEKPRGIFILDNYLYYCYGKERKVKVFDFHNFNFHYTNEKDFSFAKLNLGTMENEEITRKLYEETWDYQDFRQWSSNTTEPIKGLDIFVWLDYDSENSYFYKSKGYAGVGYNGKGYKKIMIHILH